MNWKLWLILGAIGYAVMKSRYPHWYEDLTLRSYAGDNIASPGDTPESKSKFETAAKVAQQVGLPIGWILEIAGKYQDGDLTKIASRVQQKVLQMGPPNATDPATLAAYKDAALAAAGN